MKVLFLGINYWPEETGIAVYTTGRAEYLAARGHQVTVCTGFPYYPQWRIAPEYRGKLLAREQRNGVDIRRSWLYVPARVTSLKRILHEASFIASSLLRALGSARPEILVVTSPPLGLGVAGVLLSRIWRVPLVFQVEDLQPDAAVDLGMLAPGRLTDLLYAVERFIYRRSSLVTTIAGSMRERIISKGIAADKVAIFNDWSDEGLLSGQSGGIGERFRLSHGLNGKTLVVHAGNMGVKQGLEVVLEAARRHRERHDIAYLLVGDGAVRPALEQRACSLALNNLKFLPLQPKDGFADLMAASDICLVTQQRTVGDIVFPSKVRTILAAGRVLLASVNQSSEVARVVTAAGAGLVVPAEDAGALAEAVGLLAANPQRRREMGSAGRRYALQTWDPLVILPQMERELIRIGNVNRAEQPVLPIPTQVDDSRVEGGR